MLGFANICTGRNGRKADRTARPQNFPLATKGVGAQHDLPQLRWFLGRVVRGLLVTATFAKGKKRKGTLCWLHWETGIGREGLKKYNRCQTSGERTWRVLLWVGRGGFKRHKRRVDEKRALKRREVHEGTKSRWGTIWGKRSSNCNQGGTKGSREEVGEKADRLWASGQFSTRGSL